MPPVAVVAKMKFPIDAIAGAPRLSCVNQARGAQRLSSWRRHVVTSSLHTALETQMKEFPLLMSNGAYSPANCWVTIADTLIEI